MQRLPRPSPTGTWRARSWGLAAWVLLVAPLVAAACGGEDPPPTEGSPALPPGVVAPVAPSGAAAPPVPAAPRPVVANPNPLKLPPRELDLAAGARVFAVPEAMLNGAKLGSTLVLAAAKVVSRDGDALLLETREGAPYKLHPAYVIPIDAAAKRPGVGDPVLAEWAGVLRHGVLRAWKKDRPVVRFFDASDNGDRVLDGSLLQRAQDGFRPGNYAAARIGDELHHVLLVSPVEGESKRWLVLGLAGAAMLVEEIALSAIPVRWEPKENAPVLAESLGRMRPGVVKSLDRPGLATVKFERAGRPSVLGWGFLMPPTRGGR